MELTGSIVLFHNNRNILRSAIDSFINSNLTIKLILIDNSSNSSLKDIIIDERVEYLKMPINIGFGAAHNVAIKRAFELGSKYHLVLNPDIYFEKGTLEKIQSYMNMNPEFGHLMPKVLYPNGEIQYLCKTNPTVFDLFARRFLPKSLQKLFKSRMARYDFQDRDYSQIMYDIPYLSGCFMFLRTETLKKVGLFDERIFMYIEDADLTRRFLKQSRTVYYPDATVFHYFAKGSHKSWKLTWYSIHGAYIYFRKWGLRLI